VRNLVADVAFLLFAFAVLACLVGALFFVATR